MFRLFRYLKAFSLARTAAAVLFALVSMPAGGAYAADRLALVIGNSNYDKGFGKLEKPGPDADKMADLFRSFGYQVEKPYKDIATKADFADVVKRFVDGVTPGAEVLIYYSGHGFSGVGASKKLENYFVPTSAQGLGKFTEESKDPLKAGPYKGMKYAEYVFQVSFSQRELEDKLNAKKPAIIVYLYDHCRDTLQKGVELEAVNDQVPTTTSASTVAYYIYAAGPNERALEIDLSKKADSKDKKALIETLGVDTKISIFANALARHAGNGTLDSAASRIAEMVYVLTSDFGDGQRQKPHIVGYIPYRYLLNRNGQPVKQCQDAEKSLDTLRDIYRKGRLTPDILEQELARYEGCEEVYNKINDLKHQMPGREEGAPRVIANLPQGQQQIPEGPAGECDLLAASSNDPARPQYAIGVDLNGLVREALIDSKHISDARKVLDKAIEFCTKATENKHLARPRFNLARAYLARARLQSGDAKARDLYQATMNYQDAESKGYVAALNDLGYMHQEGLIVNDPDSLLLNRDPRLAVDYYRRGAELGMTLAQYNIGLVYRDGSLGEKEDKTKAYRYFSRAAESEYLPAMIETAVALWNGAGLPQKDHDRAITMLKRAAEKGSVHAYYLLGWTYENGKNTGGPEEGDPLRGLIWYTRAAELGDAGAFEKVAQLLTEAPGLPDTQRVAAARYWRLAAESGSRKATLQLARMLLNKEIQFKPGDEKEPSSRIESLTFVGYAAAFVEKAKWHTTGFSFSNQEVFAKDNKKAVAAAESAISIGKSAEEDLDARTKEYEARQKAAEEEKKKSGKGDDAKNAKQDQEQSDTKFNPETYRNTLDSENAEPQNQFLAAATIFKIAGESPGDVSESRVQELRKTYGAPEKLTYLPFRCWGGSPQIFAVWDWDRDGSPLDWQFKWRKAPMAWQNSSETCSVSLECEKRMSEAYKRFKQQKDAKDKKPFVAWVIGARDQLDAEIAKGRFSKEETCKYFGL